MGKGEKVDPSFESGKWHEKKKREAWVGIIFKPLFQYSALKFV